MNADIYERHKLAVFEWQKACEAVENAEHNRDAARAKLDDASHELLASCANSASKPEKKTRRRRTSKSEWTTPADGGTMPRKPNGLEDHA